MSGYQEVFTDPSYRGQIVVMTAPLIGNYGINTEDPESARRRSPAWSCASCPARTRTGARRATWGLGSPRRKSRYFEDVDTRRLTRHLRTVGVMRGVIGAGDRARRGEPRRARRVSVDGGSRPRVARHHARALHVGRPAGATPHRRVRLRDQAQHPAAVRRARLPRDRGARRDTTAEEVLALEARTECFCRTARAIPTAVAYAPGRSFARSPQAASRSSASASATSSLGSPSARRPSKMPYGHRGGNHPVKEVETGRVLITSQNHGFAVEGDEAGRSRARPTSRSRTSTSTTGPSRGCATGSCPIFAVQYHPEAAPGPHDARPLFEEFLKRVRRGGREVASNSLTHNS